MSMRTGALLPLAIESIAAPTLEKSPPDFATLIVCVIPGGQTDAPFDPPAPLAPPAPALPA
jgi:hypothetical protein